MRKGNGGQVLVIVVLALAVILGFAALAIDIGYLAAVRGELQRSADSGATAGASVFKDNTVLPGDQVVVATAVAEGYASANPVAGSPLNNSETTVVVVPADNMVRVTATRTVGLFFARVIGIDQRTITVQAAARVTAIPGPPPDNIVQLVE